MFEMQLSIFVNELTLKVRYFSESLGFSRFEAFARQQHFNDYQSMLTYIRNKQTVVYRAWWKTAAIL